MWILYNFDFLLNKCYVCMEIMQKIYLGGVCSRFNLNEVVILINEYIYVCISNCNLYFGIIRLQVCLKVRDIIIIYLNLFEIIVKVMYLFIYFIFKEYKKNN